MGWALLYDTGIPLYLKQDMYGNIGQNAKKSHKKEPHK